MRNILVGDDRRLVPFKATYARTSSRALALLKSRTPLSELWLDNDLGGTDTAMVVVDTLAECAFNGHPYPVTRIVVHTSNPSGAATMVRVLERWDYDVTRMPAPMPPPGLVTSVRRLGATLSYAYWRAVSTLHRNRAA